MKKITALWKKMRRDGMPRADADFIVGQLPTLAVTRHLTSPLGALAARSEWRWVRRHPMELLALIAMPASVIVGFEAAYFTTTARAAIAEFGRYAFPAIGPLAIVYSSTFGEGLTFTQSWIESG